MIFYISPNILPAKTYNFCDRPIHLLLKIVFLANSSKTERHF